nr:MAG TPA: hypothetical protein [Caudoviricetes sp.]
MQMLYKVKKKIRENKPLLSLLTFYIFFYIFSNISFLCEVSHYIHLQKFFYKTLLLRILFV